MKLIMKIFLKKVRYTGTYIYIDMHLYKNAIYKKRIHKTCLKFLWYKEFFLKNIPKMYSQNYQNSFKKKSYEE